LSVLESQLRALRLPTGAPLMIHASLRRVGLGRDGAPALYQTLLRQAHAHGTAAIMPAFSYQCEDPAAWMDPPLPASQVAARQEQTPAFDRSRSPVHAEIGFLAEYFRRQPGTVRSIHPVLSFSAIGPAAAAATGSQGLHFPLGPVSPLGWLVEQHGIVLLVGTGLATLTLMHLAETAAAVSYVRASRCRVRTKQGWTWYWGSPGDRRNFSKAADLLAAATVARGPLGKADAVAVDAAHFTSALISRLDADPGWLLCDDPGCPFCLAARRYLAGLQPEIVYGEQRAGECAPAQPALPHL